ncbi:GtrA family protein [uncultured Granulicatella sp.]|uniref:GtrA family protein n=1 Tax=uncultured Granulicatella sp. TaxID=316089 RepID=UPI0028DB8E2C|nr:GtrA family protein [uncultured Granulicatella sp.]
MKKILSSFFDATFLKFILVGVVNTLIGTAIMFFCFNVLAWSYWISSAMNYIVGSIVSYLLNKRYTFQQKGHDWHTVWKFIVNITICYVLAYGLAKPLVTWLLSGVTMNIQGNVALLVGMVLFVGLNYIGQRFWTFSSKKDVA